MVNQADSLKLENLVHVQYNKEQSCRFLCTRRRLIIRTMIPLHQFRIHASGSICKIIKRIFSHLFNKKNKNSLLSEERREVLDQKKLKIAIKWKTTILIGVLVSYEHIEMQSFLISSLSLV